MTERTPDFHLGSGLWKRERITSVPSLEVKRAGRERDSPSSRRVGRRRRSVPSGRVGSLVSRPHLHLGHGLAGSCGRVLLRKLEFFHERSLFVELQDGRKGREVNESSKEESEEAGTYSDRPVKLRRERSKRQWVATRRGETETGRDSPFPAWRWHPRIPSSCPFECASRWARP